MDNARALAIGAALVAIGMLLYALLGSPPYPFFGYLRLVVAAASGLCAYVVFADSKWMAPVSVGLVLTGWVELTGKMQREQWVPWNWASAGLLGFSIFLCAVSFVEAARKRESAESA